MNDEKNDSSYNDEDETSLKEVIQKTKILWKYLLSKWYLILIFGLLGSALGLVKSLLSKPVYTANLSFALIEKNAGGSGLAALASSFGMGGLGGNDNAFSGDNLLEIIQSRYAVEQTLLTPINYKGEKKTLIEAYIQFNELREKWQNGNKKELSKLCYPIGQNRETFTRVQDSVLYRIYKIVCKPNALNVARMDKKISIVNVTFSSQDEVFSKLFVEKLMAETSRFYSETRTSQSRANINMMQETADSIKHLYESALYRSAGYSQVNINAALQFAAVPKIKQENNAQLYATVYAEVLKNLETLKLDLARETPLVQIIDTPRYPLLKEKLGKAKGLLGGGFIGGILIVMFLLGKFYINNALKEEE